jgi:hypothetical protein
MAGYSTKSLFEKLGIKEGVLLVVDAPLAYEAQMKDLPPTVERVSRIVPEIDVIHLFVTSVKDCKDKFNRLKPYLSIAGKFWVSWPKQTSNVPTDVNENIVREIGLANGLVDVKVCAIDNTWSGLKFVYRLRDRKH